MSDALLCVGNNEQIVLLDVEQCAVLKVLECRPSDNLLRDPVNYRRSVFAVSKNGKMLIIGGGGSELCLLDVESGSTIATLTNNTRGSITNCALSLDQRCVAHDLLYRFQRVHSLQVHHLCDGQCHGTAVGYRR